MKRKKKKYNKWTQSFKARFDNHTAEQRHCLKQMLHCTIVVLKSPDIHRLLAHNTLR